MPLASRPVAALGAAALAFTGWLYLDWTAPAEQDQAAAQPAGPLPAAPRMRCLPAPPPPTAQPFESTVPSAEEPLPLP